MNKNIIIGAVVLVALGLIGWLIFKDNREPEASPSPSASVAVSTTPTPKPVIHTVRVTDQGLQPATLTIRTGDGVTFYNDSSIRFWPASDPYPADNGCPGFNAGYGLNFGERYTLTFTIARTCTYHNELDYSNRIFQGTIIVR